MVGYGSPRVTQAQVDAANRAREKRERDDHNEGMRDHASEAAAYQQLNREFPLTTDFGNIDIDTMKSMLDGVDPGGVEAVGHHWEKVHDHLVGPGGGGSGDSAYGQLQKAVENVMEHWEGESANQFRRQADHILQQIHNTASHAKVVSTAVKQTGGDIRTQKAALDAIEKPSWFSSAWDSLTDSGRSDKYTQEEIENRTLPKDVLADIDEGYLSAGKESQLKAAAVMERLARSYVQTQAHLKSAAPYDDHKSSIPPASPSIPMPTPIPPFSGSSSTPSSSRPTTVPAHLAGIPKPGEVTGPRDIAVSGGKQIPISNTQIDGLQSGITGNPEALPNGKLPGGSTGPGGPLTKAPMEPGGFPGGFPGGKPGGGSGSRLPNGRLAGPHSGIGGGASEEGRAGGRSGGMRGMHGMGGGGGAGKGGGSAAGGRGPLARAKGGVAGAPKGITGGRGPATPGGTGLGKGRGGGASAAGGRGARGMFAGGMRGTSQRPGEEENEEGTRPDYLVEDEETWTPEDGRSVPRNIE
jgi:hypothetical protein